MEYWKKYNEKLNKFASLMIKHNQENEFNFIENNFYNHIRDLIALSISMIQSEDQSYTPIKILDYGSNITTWANIHRKINTDSIDVTVFDPYHDAQTFIKDLGFQFKVLSEVDHFVADYFDLTIFGSSIQYKKNFLTALKLKNSYLGDYVLFTHTPLSLEKQFVSKQFSDYKGTQTVHSFEDISNLFKKLGYKLYFKSSLPPEAASVEDKFINKTVYANLLFKKFIN